MCVGDNEAADEKKVINEWWGSTEIVMSYYWFIIEQVLSY